MTFILTLLTIIKNFSISLGVGASTLAILNFFSAIADGTIDQTERRMMGVVYVVLRVAMVLILLTLTFSITYEYLFGEGVTFSGILSAEILTILVLYTNALLMTLSLIPSTFGPAIQAGSWYTLGVLSSLQVINLDGFSLANFIMSYVTWLILATALVNGTMAFMKAIGERRKNKMNRPL